MLVVDDQPGKLLTYQAILQDIDAHLVLAESARGALDHLLRTEFAVVIIDVCMPELDGFELAAMIREHPRFQRTAIIFVSGVHLTELDRLKGYEVGAVDYLPVPIVPAILRAKVNVFVELYRKTQEVRATGTASSSCASRSGPASWSRRAARRMNSWPCWRTSCGIRSRRSDRPRPSSGCRRRRRTLRDKCSAVIQRQVEHLVRLIDDLVDVSRITRGLVELKREPIAIAEVVAQAIEASRPAIDARRHLLTVDVSEDADAWCSATSRD